MSRNRGRREFKSNYKRKFRLPKALTSSILALIILITGYFGFKSKKNANHTPEVTNASIEIANVEVPEITYDEDINMEEVKVPDSILASKIFILDSADPSILENNTSNSKYYYLYRTDISSMFEDNIICYYFDILDDNGLAVISSDNTYMAYKNSLEKASINAISLTNDSIVKNINDFLASKNLQGYIKESYTKSDLEHLNEVISKLSPTYIAASDILVMDSSSSSVYYPENSENFYFLYHDTSISSIYNEFNYRDLFNNFAFACISDNYRIGEYADLKSNIRISYWTISDEEPACMSLTDFLVKNGLNDLVKEKYTSLELQEIYNYICTSSLKRVRTS